MQAAVDEQIDFANDILDADEWTEESTGERLRTLTEVCAATFATSATGS